MRIYVKKKKIYYDVIQDERLGDDDVYANKKIDTLAMRCQYRIIIQDCCTRKFILRQYL